MINRIPIHLEKSNFSLPKLVMAYGGGHKNVHAQIICEYWKIASALFSDACLGQKGIVCCQLAMYAYTGNCKYASIAEL